MTKKISVNWLVDRINADKKLTKEEKFEKVIDIAYKRIYGVKEETWDNNVKKVRTLVGITEKENKKSKELGIREAVNSFFHARH